MSVLDLEVSLLEQWRELIEKLGRLDQEFTSQYIQDFDQTLAKEFSRKPRNKLLPDVDTWQKALDAMELDVRKEATMKELPDVDLDAAAEDFETEEDFADSFDDTYQPNLSFKMLKILKKTQKKKAKKTISRVCWLLIRKPKTSLGIQEFLT